MKYHTNEKNQPKRTSNVIVKMPEIKTSTFKNTSKVNILNFKQQFDEQTEVLNEVTKKHTEQSKAMKEKILSTSGKSKAKNGKKSKLSPHKSLLREQLKQQLEEQRKLLQVQQEIFEKANKAQNDIYELLAKLGDDEDENDEEENESVESEEVEKQSPKPELRSRKQPVTQNAAVKHEEYSEVYLQDENFDNITEYITPNDEIIIQDNDNIDQQLLLNDGYILLNEEHTSDGIVEPNDQNVVVVVRSEEGDEEYELIEVIDEHAETDPLQMIDNPDIDFEIVGSDSNGVHCRIISNETNDVYSEQEDKKALKMPVKVDVGKIPMKYFQKSTKDESKAKTNDSSEKLLNKSVHKSEKQIGEDIQKIVQNAVPTEDSKFECPMCHEFVSNRYSLGPHILRLHSKQKNKICPHCDRAFTCTGDLTR